MMSRIPPSPPPEVAPRNDPQRIRQVRSYKVITPLFGGGVESGKADPVTIIRAAEVRGHLRFWWRATRGSASDGDLRRMRDLEEKIWGSAAAKDRAGPSEVRLALVVRNRGTPFQATTRNGKPIHIGSAKSQDSYAAFPLRQDTNAAVLENIQFDLELSFPEACGSDVRAALWAWETFGGIGARTRRGFGSLQCVQVDGELQKTPSLQEAERFVKNGLRERVADGEWPPGTPHLSRHLRFVLAPAQGRKDALEAWRFLIHKLRQFRQARSGGPFGRSKWPEANAIRRLTGKSSSRHRPGRGIDKFPRAQFGLPIIFKFKDSDVKQGDPEPATLCGAEHERFASPLLLRPLACRGAAIGLAAVLEGPEEPPGGCVLKTDASEMPVVAKLEPSEAASVPPLSGTSDAIGKFLESL